ncbi:MAG: hypothetical protein HWE16_05805 [Gammaproteobacteria bacterium]|nr:hypothetical protein [Gammaproteobacteria bacterium]
MNNKIFSRYWSIYGGWKALLKSRYFQSSILITFLLFPHWSKAGWWNDILSIMPSLLGFSLGGYAMWMAIGDDDFRKLISGESKSGKPSPYMDVNAAFVHFILLQLISIVLALFVKAYYFELSKDSWVYENLAEYIYIASYFVYFLVYLIFIYALASTFAATLALFRVSSWYDLSQSTKSASDKDD